jgi:undecaprenyl-diphosphatase
MHDFLDVLILAVLQGVAEFLPISSSGHLVIAQSLLRFNHPGVRLEVVLHVGTLVSVLVYYRRLLAKLIKGAIAGERESWLMAGYIALSAVPAVFFYLLIQDKVNVFFEDPRAIGGFLVFTGFVLCILRWITSGDGEVTAARAVLVGLAQALAVLPGVSRSGMTIVAGRLAGVSPDKAAEFSFLMCVPLLVGAAFMDALHPVAAGESFPWWLLLMGATVSATVGYVALSSLVRVLRAGRFWLFGLYCIAVGIAVVLFI